MIILAGHGSTVSSGFCPITLRAPIFDKRFRLKPEDLLLARSIVVAGVKGFSNAVWNKGETEVKQKLVIIERVPGFLQNKDSVHFLSQLSGADTHSMSSALRGPNER